MKPFAIKRQIIREFAETYTIPVATTLSNKGMLPENHPLSLGNFGFSGSRRAQETLLGSEADLILVLGADFNERDFRRARRFLSVLGFPDPRYGAERVFLRRGLRISDFSERSRQSAARQRSVGRDRYRDCLDPFAGLVLASRRRLAEAAEANAGLPSCRDADRSGSRDQPNPQGRLRPPPAKPHA